MRFTCRRCDDVFEGRPYTVSSEDAGTTLLNMKVCRRCYELACSLGLHAEPMAASPRSALRRDPMYFQPAPK